MKWWPWAGRGVEKGVPDRLRPEEWERVPEPLASRAVEALRSERVEDPEVMGLVLSGALWTDNGGTLWLRRGRSL